MMSTLKVVWLKSSSRETTVLLTWILILQNYKYVCMYSAYCKNGFAYSSSSITTSSVFHVSIPMLEECCVHSLCSHFWPQNRGHGLSRAELHLVCSDTSMCSVLRDPDTTESLALCRNDLEKKTDPVPTSVSTGQSVPAGKGKGR